MNDKKLIIENGKITGTMLGYEDHGIFTIGLSLECDGSGCVYGGYALDEFDKEKKARVGTAYGLESIIAVLKTLEIEKWEKIPGTFVRIEHEGWGGKVVRIGHIMKDKWLDFSLISHDKR